MDRAALDAALTLGLPCGGWCPKGRRAEDGTIPPRYPLQETPSKDAPQRTEWNVRDSDGTLILARGVLSGGTAYTAACAKRLQRPCVVLDPTDAKAAATFQRWVQEHRIRILNVAGPRESQNPGIGAQAAELLRRVLVDRAEYLGGNR